MRVRAGNEAAVTPVILKYYPCVIAPELASGSLQRAEMIHAASLLHVPEEIHYFIPKTKRVHRNRPTVSSAL